MQRLFGWIIVLAILAFAGRPLYVCTMEQASALTAEALCGHADCEHCPAHDGAAAPEESCMLDASNPFAPAVERSDISPAIPHLIAGLDVVRALTPHGPAPSLPPDTAFESPPASITILRI